jgi:hypothetical protein
MHLPSSEEGFMPEANNRVIVMPKISPEERRTRRRFSMQMEARWRVMGDQDLWHKCATANISSGGVLVETGNPPRHGTRVELHIDWPVQLYGTVPLKLVITGEVLRSAGTQMAVQMNYRSLVTKARTPKSFAQRVRAELGFSVAAALNLTTF